MLLLADSGSTKTDWCYIDAQGTQTRFQSLGMNPYNITKENLNKEIKEKVLYNLPNNHVKEMYFYGSGCSNPQKKMEMKGIFEQYLPATVIHIEHDLLGAARAACGHKSGVAAILGTGSNSCLYDGEKITANIPSLGYILCDEGGGTYIGKIILRNYLRGQLPQELNSQFRNKYPQTETQILDNLHQGASPAKYLASFASFVIENKSHPYCRKIIQGAFDDFFKMQVTQYANYKDFVLNTVGSVGYYAADILQQIADNYGMRVDKVVKSPMDSLAEYHL